MIILYGNDNSRIDITDIVREKYTDNQGKLCIPSNDHMRAKMFGDPAYGQAKFIKIFDDELNSRIYGSGQYAHLSWDCDFRNIPPFNNRQQLLEQLKKVRDEIEKYITTHEDYKTSLGHAVRVDKFSDSSIDMYIRCFTVTDDWGEWLKVKERLAVKIKEIVESNGASFAFPSTSIYVEKK